MNWQPTLANFLKENATSVNILMVAVVVLIIIVCVQMWWSPRHHRVTIVELQPNPVSEIQKRWDRLSDRQKEIARLVAQGKQNAEVARALGIRPNTVNSHLKTIYRHFNVNSRTELARAIQDVVD